MSVSVSTKRRIGRSGISWLLSALVVGWIASCGDSTSDDDKTSGTGGDGLAGPGGDPTAWDPAGEHGECNVDALLQPESYGAKVKALLTGLPMTEDELTQLTADPSVLPSLVDDWQYSPEADEILRRFFMTAFQQTGTDETTEDYLFGRNINTGFFDDPKTPNINIMLNQVYGQSFARTALALIDQGVPFNEILTTDQFMLTTAEMMVLAYLDDDNVDDEGESEVRSSADALSTITLVANPGAAPPMSEALDPSSPDFGVFYHSLLADLPGTCNADVITVGTTNNNGDWRVAANDASPSLWVANMLMGRHMGVNRSGFSECSTGGSPPEEPGLMREDFSDWHMVTIRKPSGGEAPSAFYDLAGLRNATELVLHTERHGFYSTLGFWGTWMNNEDNSSRVTINQTLIVALGKSFDGEAVSDFSPQNLDVEHAGPGTECYGCHQTLDPMRDFFRASFTNFGGQQMNPERTGLPGDFIFEGVETAGNGIGDLRNILAGHPELPYAWAHKLCYYANGHGCPEGEELDRIVDAFIGSNLDFRVLVRELFASPIVTGSACVSGVDSGTDVTISRQPLFCASLSNRLGIEDICDLDSAVEPSNLQKQISKAVTSIPGDAFSRAVVEPVIITETGLFTRANREATCILAAEDGYDEVFGELAAPVVLDRLVVELMGVPTNDPRYQGARDILQAHYDAMVADGETTEKTALQSAMALACMAPGSAGVGF